VPGDLTEITEITTALGMLSPSLDSALLRRPDALAHVNDAAWDRLVVAYADGQHRSSFTTAFENGRAFLYAADALRGRPPLRVEWKGPHRPPGDDVIPADLRIDRVFLVSCKYVSKLLLNSGPARLFDRQLVGEARSSINWFVETARPEFQALYVAARQRLLASVAPATDRDEDPYRDGVNNSGAVGDFATGPSVLGPGLAELGLFDIIDEMASGVEGSVESGGQPGHDTLHQGAKFRDPAHLRFPLVVAWPDDVAELNREQLDVLKGSLSERTWPVELRSAWSALCLAVASESARRWKVALHNQRDQLRLLWRMLRITTATYFVLGGDGSANLRLRVDSAWDWMQEFELRSFDVVARVAGQPEVGWRAVVRRRSDGVEMPIEGHVEIRWSHGRFSGFPEAKVYLDTPHRQVPGYHLLS
jgi:hypothetical protein